MMSYPLLASLSVETGAAPHIPWQVFQRIPTILLGQPHWLLFFNTTGHSHEEAVTSSKLVLGLFYPKPFTLTEPSGLGNLPGPLLPCPLPRRRLDSHRVL